MRLAKADERTSSLGPLLAGCFGMVVLLATLACLGITIASTFDTLSRT